MKIGDKLLSLRNEFKFTQQEVADKLGIKQSTYHRWENGKTQPTVDFLPKIAEAYQIPITDLLPEGTNNIFQNNQEHYGFINSNNNQIVPNEVLDKIFLQVEHQNETIKNLLEQNKQLIELLKNKK